MPGCAFSHEPRLALNAARPRFRSESRELALIAAPRYLQRQRRLQRDVGVRPTSLHFDTIFEELHLC
jgi:hypothetical protein